MVHASNVRTFELRILHETLRARSPVCSNSGAALARKRFVTLTPILCEASVDLQLLSWSVWKHRTFGEER